MSGHQISVSLSPPPTPFITLLLASLTFPFIDIAKPLAGLDPLLSGSFRTFHWPSHAFPFLHIPALGLPTVSACFPRYLGLNGSFPTPSHPHTLFGLCDLPKPADSFSFHPLGKISSGGRPCGAQSDRRNGDRCASQAHGKDGKRKKEKGTESGVSTSKKESKSSVDEPWPLQSSAARGYASTMSNPKG